MLDLSKLAPSTRRSIFDAIYRIVNKELGYIQDDLKQWEFEGSINSNAGKEMVGWKDALIDLRIQVATESKL